MSAQPETNKTTRAYGIWQSQITPELIAASIRLSNPLWDTDGKTLVWREGRGVRAEECARRCGLRWR